MPAVSSCPLCTIRRLADVVRPGHKVRFPSRGSSKKPQLDSPPTPRPTSCTVLGVRPEVLIAKASVHVGLLGCNAAWAYRYMPAFGICTVFPFSGQKMEKLYFSETLALVHNSTRRYNPEQRWYFLDYPIILLLIPWSRNFLENLLKKFIAFHGGWKIISVLTKDRTWALTESLVPFYTLTPYFNINLNITFHLCPSCFSLSEFRINISVHFLSDLMHTNWPADLIILNFMTLIICDAVSY
jgi:hypothetical protein